MDTHSAVEKDVDIWAYIRIVRRYFFLILAIVLVSLAVTYKFVSRIPITYQSKTTFFFNTGESSGNALGNYASLLGISSEGGSDGYIMDLSNSIRLRSEIDKKMAPILEKYHIKDPNLTFKLQKQGSVLVLTGESDYPQIPKVASHIYLDEIYTLILELGLSNRRDMITILDKPTNPTANKSKVLSILSLAGIAAFLGGCVTSIFIDFLRKNRHKITS